MLRFGSSGFGGLGSRGPGFRALGFKVVQAGEGKKRGLPDVETADLNLGSYGRGAFLY